MWIKSADGHEADVVLVSRRSDAPNFSAVATLSLLCTYILTLRSHLCEHRDVSCTSTRLHSHAAIWNTKKAVYRAHEVPKDDGR